MTIDRVEADVGMQRETRHNSIALTGRRGRGSLHFGGLREDGDGRSFEAAAAGKPRSRKGRLSDVPSAILPWQRAHRTAAQPAADVGRIFPS